MDSKLIRDAGHENLIFDLNFECEVKEMESYIASTLELSGKPGPPPVVADDEEAPEEVVVDPSKVADIMNFTQLFQWCGIDLGIIRKHVDFTFLML